MRAGGEPTGGELGPLVGEKEPPAGEVGGEKRGDEAGDPPPERGSDTVDIPSKKKFCM